MAAIQYKPDGVFELVWRSSAHELAGYREVIPRYLGLRRESSRGVTSSVIVELTPSRIEDRIASAAVLSHAPSPLLSLRTGKL